MKAQSSLVTGPRCHSHCAASGSICSQSIVLVLHLFCFEWQEVDPASQASEEALTSAGFSQWKKWVGDWVEGGRARACSLPQVASPAGVVYFPLLDRPILVSA